MEHKPPLQKKKISKKEAKEHQEGFFEKKDKEVSKEVF
jgi:hypothetical protein